MASFMQKTLGTFIRERRMDLGLTQEQLAERVGEGVRQSEISRLEHDGIALPRRSRMEEIAAALEVSIGDLLVTTGWMDEDHRSALSPDANGIDDLLAREPDSVRVESLEAAMESLEATQGLVAQTAAMLDTAEQAVATAMHSLNMTRNTRGSVRPTVGVIREWESSAVLPA